MLLRRLESVWLGCRTVGYKCKNLWCAASYKCCIFSLSHPCFSLSHRVHALNVCQAVWQCLIFVYCTYSIILYLIQNFRLLWTNKHTLNFMIIMPAVAKGCTCVCVCVCVHACACVCVCDVASTLYVYLHALLDHHCSCIWCLIIISTQWLAMHEMVSLPGQHHCRSSHGRRNET